MGFSKCWSRRDHTLRSGFKPDKGACEMSSWEGSADPIHSSTCTLDSHPHTWPCPPGSWQDAMWTWVKMNIRIRIVRACAGIPGKPPGEAKCREHRFVPGRPPSAAANNESREALPRVFREGKFLKPLRMVYQNAQAYTPPPRSKTQKKDTCITRLCQVSKMAQWVVRPKHLSSKPRNHMVEEENWVHQIFVSPTDYIHTWHTHSMQM